MRKPIVLTAAAVPTALAIGVVALYALAPTIAPATVRPPARTASAAGTPEFMPIVPATVIDPKGEIFIGTGDGSGGGWIKPQTAPTQTQPPMKAAKRAKEPVAATSGRKETKLHAAASRPRATHPGDAAGGAQTYAGTDRDGALVR